jgi:hypothetical protein
MAYPPIFWDCVRNVFVFHAVSETQIASDLGLDRKHLREVARKMEWEKSRRKPSIPELIRLRNFYEAHTLERKRPDAVRTQIKEATEMHNWMVELALLFKHREFDSMEGVNGYLKRRRIALADLLLERFQKRYWGDDDTLRRDRGVLGGSFAGKI